MELFAKIVNGLKPLTIFAKHFIVDVFMGSECASESTFTQPAFTYSRSRSGVFIVNFEHILHLVLVFIDGLCSTYTSLFEHWRCLSLTKKCLALNCNDKPWKETFLLQKFGIERFRKAVAATLKISEYVCEHSSNAESPHFCQA